MDQYEALALAAAEHAFLSQMRDEENKKMNGDGSHQHHHQSEKKQRNNKDDGGSNNNGKETKKKKMELLESVTVVMKVDFHCVGCRRRIFDAARSFRGVETVKVEEEKSKLTVVGRVDPVKLHEKLERSLRKKIDLVSPQPKKKDKKNNNGGGSGDQNSNNKKPKEPPLTTVVLKISLHCDGCRRRISQILRKTEGVHTVEIDGEKDLVTVRGAVEPKAVQMRLKMKMKRSAEIVPAKKDKDQKMEQCNGGGGKQKQQQQQQKCQQMCCCGNGSNNGRSGAEEMNALMEYYGPIYGHIPVAGYVVERIPAPQIFSDENPNACSVM